MPSKIVSKNLLQKFIQHRKLSGVVDFLNFIRKGKNLKSFYDFCAKHNQKLLLPADKNMQVLFHGSLKSRSILSPSKSFVYATEDPNYAIFLAILDLKNSSAGVISGKETILTVDSNFVNGASKLKNGYVHVVSGKSFKKLKNREYRTNKDVSVLFAIPVSPKDLTVPIKIEIAN